MKINKELILETAFGLFYEYGYKEMSITVLQEKLNIGRATLYYYFKGKEELLLNAIEVYYIEEFNSFYNSLNENLTIEEFIHKYVDYYRGLYDKLSKYSKEEDYVFIKLYSLLNYSASHFPGIKEKLKTTRIRKFRLWKRAVEESHSRGDIKKDIDIDIITSLFFSITYETYKNNDKETVNDIESLDGYKKSCLLLYELIK